MQLYLCVIAREREQNEDGNDSIHSALRYFLSCWCHLSPPRGSMSVMVSNWAPEVTEDSFKEWLRGEKMDQNSALKIPPFFHPTCSDALAFVLWRTAALARMSVSVFCDENEAGKKNKTFLYILYTFAKLSLSFSPERNKIFPIHPCCFVHTVTTYIFIVPFYHLIRNDTLTPTGIISF